MGNHVFIILSSLEKKYFGNERMKEREQKNQSIQTSRNKINFLHFDLHLLMGKNNRELIITQTVLKKNSVSFQHFSHQNYKFAERFRQSHIILKLCFNDYHTYQSNVR